MLLPRLSPGLLRSLVWLAGGLALLAAVLSWVADAQLYPAPWAWISFIGMCILDDFVFGSNEDEPWSELPKVALLAAVIVFRRHPEITVLIAVSAAPLASLVKGQPWSLWLTTTAHWVLAAVLGAVTFRLIGFEDTQDFVVATAALLVVYTAVGLVLTSVMKAAATGANVAILLRVQGRNVVLMELAGPLLALAWRTSWLQPAALKVADGVLVVVAGVIAGRVLGGRAGNVFKRGVKVPVRPLVVIGVLLVASEVAPGALSWLLPLGAAVVVGIWAVWRKAYPVACGALGACCNELVRAANGGRMPVDAHGVLAEVGGQSSKYVIADGHTNFAWLGDRFLLPPPFPGIASIGDILIALAMAWLVASLMFRRPASDVAADPPEEVVAA
jgi:uncharacterized protein DUF5317